MRKSEHLVGKHGHGRLAARGPIVAPVPSPTPISRLARREREVAEAVRALGEASAAEVETGLPHRLSNSAIRSMLARLQAKGIVRRRKVGRKHLYSLTVTDKTTRIALLQCFCRENSKDRSSSWPRPR